MDEHRRLEQLSRTRALDLLSSVNLGRLVFTHQALPAIRPVNHLVECESIIVRATAGAAIICPAPAMAQQESRTDELTRKPKTKVSPVYPELARRMSITGTVRLAVVVAPNGQVKNTKAIGGHPILVNAAMDAMKQWKFEPAPAESTGVVEFRFQPQE